jgi:hypothetical protein
VDTVTDGLQPTARPQRSAMQHRVAATAGARDRAQSAQRRRRAHPLLGAFPLAVMTLGTFLVLFALMMSRLKASTSPALPSSSGTALLARPSMGGAIRTRASGGATAAIATSVAAPERSGATAPAIVTRTSGGAGAGGPGDD